MHILVIYGSLREKSLNKALARATQILAPEGMSIDLHGPGSDLPFYSNDLEISAFPPAATKIKTAIRSADGVLFVTPEFNRSIPGVLKNLIDWTSRPSGDHPWGGKPVGVIGASSGARGTIVAQYDLKRVMTYFGAHVLGQPEFYLDNSDKKIDAVGSLNDEKTKEYLKKYLTAFKAHIEKLS